MYMLEHEVTALYDGSRSIFNTLILFTPALQPQPPEVLQCRCGVVPVVLDAATDPTPTAHARSRIAFHVTGLRHLFPLQFLIFLYLQFQLVSSNIRPRSLFLTSFNCIRRNCFKILTFVALDLLTKGFFSILVHIRILYLHCSEFQRRVTISGIPYQDRVLKNALCTTFTIIVFPNGLYIHRMYTRALQYTLSGLSRYNLYCGFYSTVQYLNL